MECVESRGRGRENGKRCEYVSRRLRHGDRRESIGYGEENTRDEKGLNVSPSNGGRRSEKIRKTEHTDACQSQSYKGFTP